MPHFDSRAFPPRAPQISTDHYDKAMGSACNNLAPHSRDCATIIYKVGMVRKGATRLLSKIQGGVLGEPSCLNMHLETGSSESAQPQIPPARFSQPREASPYESRQCPPLSLVCRPTVFACIHPSPRTRVTRRRPARRYVGCSPR